jgi:hypothetical protein
MPEYPMRELDEGILIETFPVSNESCIHSLMAVLGICHAYLG